MWKGKQIIILFSLLLGLFLVTVTTQEETEAQKRARCKDLDETRANFTVMNDDKLSSYVYLGSKIFLDKGLL